MKIDTNFMSRLKKKQRTCDIGYLLIAFIQKIIYSMKLPYKVKNIIEDGVAFLKVTELIIEPRFIPRSIYSYRNTFFHKIRSNKRFRRP